MNLQSSVTSNLRAPRVPYMCQNCGEPFFLRESVARARIKAGDNPTYCGMSCAHAVRRREAAARAAIRAAQVAARRAKAQASLLPVEKGVPKPPTLRRHNWARGGRKYPWGTMDILDSFVFPPPKDGAPALYRAGNQIIARHRIQRHRYEVHEVDGVVRVWRVA